MGKQEILKLLQEAHPRKLSSKQLAEKVGVTAHNLSNTLRRLQMDRDIVSIRGPKGSKLWGLRGEYHPEAEDEKGRAD